MLDPNTLSLPDLFPALVEPDALRTLLALARDEDLGDAGDVTSVTIIDAGRRGAAGVVPRADGVIAGLAAVPVILDVFAADVAFETMLDDGASCGAGRPVAWLRGSLRDLLTVERTVLNLLGRLSGVATTTRQFAQSVAGTGAVITDTRKTTPGWRGLEKYAVRCGGGTLHRLGLYDAALYKDNHIAGLAGDALADAVRRAAADARARFDLRFVEVEVDGLDQLEALLGIPPEAGRGLVDLVLLDNFDVDMLVAAVALRDRLAPGVRLEASGGVAATTARAVAESGIDRIAIGALTHSAAWLDVGLDIGPDVGVSDGQGT